MPIVLTSFFLHCSAPHRYLHSFPTRRSSDLVDIPVPPHNRLNEGRTQEDRECAQMELCAQAARGLDRQIRPTRSEEHTSELQSRGHLVCRLLLEKKKNKTIQQITMKM